MKTFPMGPAALKKREPPQKNDAPEADAEHGSEDARNDHAPRLGSDTDDKHGGHNTGNDDEKIDQCHG